MWIKFKFDWYLDLFIQDGGQLKSIQLLYTNLILNHRLKYFIMEFDEALLSVIPILHKHLGRFAKSNLMHIFNCRVGFESQSSCI